MYILIVFFFVQAKKIKIKIFLLVVLYFGGMMKESDGDKQWREWGEAMTTLMRNGDVTRE